MRFALSSHSTRRAQVDPVNIPAPRGQRSAANTHESVPSIGPLFHASPFVFLSRLIPLKELPNCGQETPDSSVSVHAKQVGTLDRSKRASSA